ncbi:MAG: sulfatase-like hydrolase/transferase [Pyrinomonadaceae bacterium]
MLRDAALALSLANLCFVKVWSKLLSSAGSYFNETPIVYLSIVLDVLLLAAFFFIAATLVRRCGNATLAKLMRAGFLFALLVSANGVVSLVSTFSAFNPVSAIGRSGASVTAFILTALAVSALFRWRQRISSAAPKVVLALFPFLLLTFFQAGSVFIKPEMGVAHAAVTPPINAPSKRQKAASRVLWIVFDEMDQRMSFAERPAGLSLPELDRLRNQSLYAANAYPPAPLTYMSMPALITGRLISKVTPVRSDELMINFDGEREAVGWSAQPNVFGEARKAGFTTGLVGWCHPYCSVIGASLTRCEVVKERSEDEITLKGSMFSQAQGLVATIPLFQQISIPLIQRVGFLNKLALHQERQKYIFRYKSVLDGALKAATNRDLDLVLLHVPAPHPPGIYNAQRQDFSLEGDASYTDNLALVDRTVGELRRAMENASVWDETTVLVTADHWWRTEMWARGPFWNSEDERTSGGKSDHRIPFVLKLAGEKTPVTYDAPFNTILTHDLLLAFLRGEVRDAGSVTQWLDSHRSIADSPYNRDDLLP